MSDIVNAQEEFEVLIDQLEKLKTVNEITTRNTENSATLIKVLKTFIKELSPFLDKVNKNHNQIVAKIKSTVTALDESIGESKTVNKKTQTIVAEHLAKVEEDLEEIKKLENTTQDKFAKMFEALKKVLEEEKKTQENLTKTTMAIKNTVERVGESVAELKLSNQKEFNQQAGQLKFVKIMAIVILVLLLTGFGGMIYLMQMA